MQGSNSAGKLNKCLALLYQEIQHITKNLPRNMHKELDHGFPGVHEGLGHCQSRFTSDPETNLCRYFLNLMGVRGDKIALDLGLQREILVHGRAGIRPKFRCLNLQTADANESAPYIPAFSFWTYHSFATVHVPVENFNVRKVLWEPWVESPWINLKTWEMQRIWTFCPHTN